MTRRTIAASAAAVAAVLAVVSPAAADTTVIGNVGQSSSQAVNSVQSAENGTGGGSTYVLGSSAPTLTQNSSNELVNVQQIGGTAGNTTLIAGAPNDCFCQSNTQGVNSQQVGANGDGNGAGTTVVLGDSSPRLTQNSTNTLVNVQLITGGMLPPGVPPGTVFFPCHGCAPGVCEFKPVGAPPFHAPCPGELLIIGGTSQVNDQGVNSTQSGQNGGSGGGELVIGGASDGVLDQNSLNDLASVVLISG